MKILLDTNVLLDIILKREGWEYAYQLFEMENEYCLSASQVTDVYYIVNSKDKSFDREKLKFSLRALRIMPVDEIIIEKAFESALMDFEDAVVEQVAVVEKMDYILTRNIKDFELSKVPAMTVESYGEMLEMHTTS